MSEFDKLHQHLKECVDSDNDSFIGITEDGVEFNMFEWAFGLSINAKKEVERISIDRQNAIKLMSKSWRHVSDNHDDLITRYVTMAENQFNKMEEEIEHITAIATKRATRADELYEALENLLGSTNTELVGDGGYLYWTTTIDDESVIEAQRVLSKSRTEADK